MRRGIQVSQIYIVDGFQTFIIYGECCAQYVFHLERYYFFPLTNIIAKPPNTLCRLVGRRSVVLFYGTEDYSLRLLGLLRLSYESLISSRQFGFVTQANLLTFNSYRSNMRFRRKFKTTNESVRPSLCGVFIQS